MNDHDDFKQLKKFLQTNRLVTPPGGLAQEERILNATVRKSSHPLVRRFLQSPRNLVIASISVAAAAAVLLFSELEKDSNNLAKIASNDAQIAAVNALEDMWEGVQSTDEVWLDDEVLLN